MFLLSDPHPVPQHPAHPRPASQLWLWLLALAEAVPCHPLGLAPEPLLGEASPCLLLGCLQQPQKVQPLFYKWGN